MEYKLNITPEQRIVIQGELSSCKSDFISVRIEVLRDLLRDSRIAGDLIDELNQLKLKK